MARETSEDELIRGAGIVIDVVRELRRDVPSVNAGAVEA